MILGRTKIAWKEKARERRLSTLLWVTSVDELGALSGFQRAEGKVWFSSDKRLGRPPKMSGANLNSLKDVEAPAFLVEHDHC